MSYLYEINRFIEKWGENIIISRIDCNLIIWIIIYQSGDALRTCFLYYSEEYQRSHYGVDSYLYIYWMLLHNPQIVLHFFCWLSSHLDASRFHNTHIVCLYLDWKFLRVHSNALCGLAFRNRSKIETIRQNSDKSIFTILIPIVLEYFMHDPWQFCSNVLQWQRQKQQQQQQWQCRRHSEFQIPKWLRGFFIMPLRCCGDKNKMHLDEDFPNKLDNCRSENRLQFGI